MGNLQHKFFSIKHVSRHAIGTFLLFGAGGCASSNTADLEDAKNVLLDLPKEWTSTPDAQFEISSKAGSIYDVFPNHVLYGYISEAFANNPEIKAAMFRVEASYEALRPIRAKRLPQIDASTNWQKDHYRNDIDEESRIGALQVQWQFDLWGRVADEYQASKLEHEARLIDIEAARLSLAVAVMRAWLSVWEADQRLELSQLNIANIEKLQKLVDLQFELGLTSSADTKIIRAKLAQFKAFAIEAEIDGDRARRALEVLLGRYPASKITDEFDNIETKLIGINTPVSVLSERPDIQASYLRLESSIFSSRSAAKALLPDLTLSGSLSRASGALDTYPGIALWNAFAGISQPIFNGGALKAIARIEEKETQARLEDYRAVVINAVQEVENGLYFDHKVRAKLKQQVDAEQSMADARALRLREYELGLADFDSVLSTELDYAETVLERQAVQYALLDNRLQLGLALGLPLPQSGDVEND